MRSSIMQNLICTYHISGVRKNRNVNVFVRLDKPFVVDLVQNTNKLTNRDLEI